MYLIPATPVDVLSLPMASFSAHAVIRPRQPGRSSFHDRGFLVGLLSDKLRDLIQKYLEIIVANLVSKGRDESLCLFSPRAAKRACSL